VPTLAEAAEHLGVHYQTAYKWVRDGSLPGERVRGRYQIDPAILDAFARRRDEPQPVPERAHGLRWVQLADRLEGHLLHGEETAARKQVLDLRDRGVSATEIITHLFVPALQAIGAGWSAGRVTIPEEHRASGIVGRLLGELSASPRGRPRGTAVVAALSGEHHSLPTSMAAAALREDRWRVEHLGSDVPPDDVVRFAKESGADLVVLSVTAPQRTGDAQRTRRRLERAGVPTVVGGPTRTLAELAAEARALSPAARRTSTVQA